MRYYRLHMTKRFRLFLFRRMFFFCWNRILSQKNFLIACVIVWLCVFVCVCLRNSLEYLDYGDKEGE